MQTSCSGFQQEVVRHWTHSRWDHLLKKEAVAEFTSCARVCQHHSCWKTRNLQQSWLQNDIEKLFFLFWKLQCVWTTISHTQSDWNSGSLQNVTILPPCGLKVQLKERASQPIFQKKLLEEYSVGSWGTCILSAGVMLQQRTNYLSEVTVLQWASLHPYPTSNSVTS